MENENVNETTSDAPDNTVKSEPPVSTLPGDQPDQKDPAQNDGGQPSDDPNKPIDLSFTGPTHKPNDQVEQLEVEPATEAVSPEELAKLIERKNRLLVDEFLSFASESNIPQETILRQMSRFDGNSAERRGAYEAFINRLKETP